MSDENEYYKWNNAKLLIAFPPVLCQMKENAGNYDSWNVEKSTNSGHLFLRQNDN